MSLEEPSPETFLGTRIRHARLVKGLRLRDIAERSNLSESLISKIENNRATPSINTLHKIARVLDTSVAQLLDDSGSSGNVTIRKGKRMVLTGSTLPANPHYSDGTDAEVMIAFGESKLLEAFLVRVQPAGSSGGDRTHDGEETGYMVAGSLVLTVDGVDHHLNEGDSFYFESHRRHGFRNDGDVPAVIVWVNTPPTL